MKCPHCNQEHPEGTIFCPFTGEIIAPAMKSCPNPTCANHGRQVLPDEYKFCPLCQTPLTEIEDGKEGDCDLIVKVRGASVYKAAQVLMDTIKFESGPPTLEESLRLLYQDESCIGMLEKNRACDIKQRLEAAGAKVTLNSYHYYECDKCGATYREISKPKKCVRCRSHNVTFTKVNKDDVIFCPHCGSWKMNYEDGMYKCAGDFCGMYSTVEEVNEANRKK